MTKILSFQLADSPPADVTGLVEFRDWLNKLISSVPSAHLADAKIQIEYERDPYDGGGWLRFSVFYTREQTPAEVAEEAAKEKAQAEAYARQREAQERAALAALKAKYEPKG